MATPRTLRVLQAERASRYRKLGLAHPEALAWLWMRSAHCDSCSKAVDGQDKHLDHCHETLAIRGILCRSCNNMLGRALDRPAVLRAAASYLEA